MKGPPRNDTQKIGARQSSKDQSWRICLTGVTREQTAVPSASD